MELRHLRYFVAVAGELHFTRAAAHLGVAQPSLSQQIAQLERELGVVLFARAKKRVELTDAGRAFLLDAKAVLEQVTQARETAERAQRGEGGLLVVGFSGISAYDLLPRVVHAFRQRYPAVDLSLRQFGISGHRDDLIDGRIDVALVTAGRPSRQLRVEVLRREPWIVALPTGHALARRTQLRLRDLAGEKVVMQSKGAGVEALTAGDEAASALQDGFARAGVRPKVVDGGVGPASVLAMVAAGVGVSLLPASLQRFRTPHVIFKPLQDRAIAFDLVAVSRKDQSSAVIAAFLEIARATARERGI